MTPDLDAIRARLAAATPGPWHAYGNTLAAETGGCTCSPHYGAHEAHCGLEEIGQVVESDADLIAHAPADLAALLAEVERLRRTEAQIKAEALREASGKLAGTERISQRYADGFNHWLLTRADRIESEARP